MTHEDTLQLIQDQMSYGPIIVLLCALGAMAAVCLWLVRLTRSESATCGDRRLTGSYSVTSS